MKRDTNKKIHNKRLSIVIFIILAVAIVLIVGYAYAKYVTSKRGEAQAEIAEWNVSINIADNTDENVEIDLANTRNKEKEEVDVQEGVVAPGTAGKFNIEVNAENSDVSLEYEITMNADYGNNEKFPKNLIFYSDENMENAFYHTDNAIELNGFIRYDESNKKRTIPIYWKWAYQTGATDEEREKNDGLDSEWMGKSVNPLELKVVARQVNANQEENSMANQYAVTLDTNGGTLEGYGNSEKVIKQVSYGGQYGELPTPTREGYTFKGWNGKNLLNIPNTKKTLNGLNLDISNNTFHVSGANTKSDKNYGLIVFGTNLPTLEKGKTYTLSVSKKLNGLLYAQVNYSNNGTDTGLISTSNYGTVTVPESYVKTNSFFIGVVKTATAINEQFTVQLEEGNTATPHEPYFVTENTSVTQNKNHTLTAIWEKN